MLKVAYLWDADYPWDVRTEKVCAALTRAGHQVHVVARNVARRPSPERLEEGTVHRMPPWHWCGPGIDAALSFPAFFNPRWGAHLSGVVRRERPDVLVVRDLPLCPTAIWAGRRFGIPVALDMAENYPAMIRSTWEAGRQGRLDCLVRNPRLVSLVERWCLRRVDRIVTVVRESAERVAGLGVPAGRVSVVSNTPPRERARRAPAGRTRGTEDPLEIVYLGLMEVPRGVGVLLEAVRLLRDSGCAVRLRLVGDGRDRALFEAHAGSLGLTAPEVEFLGYLPNPEALAVVAAADVGVVPHHADESWNTTIPNKLFDYMAAGLPVVSSDAAPCARILAETGAGSVFRSGDARHLAEALRALRDPGLRAAGGAAGRAAVLARYNWETDSGVLLNVVEEVAAGAAAESRLPIPPRAKTTPPAPPIASTATK